MGAIMSNSLEPDRGKRQRIWEGILSKAIELEVSDIHIAVGQRIFFRLLGELKPLNINIATLEEEDKLLCSLSSKELAKPKPFSVASVSAKALPNNFCPDDNFLLMIAKELLGLSLEAIKHFEGVGELDFSYSYQARRFRGNIYYQQGHIALALRLLPDKIPSLREINAPKALIDMTDTMPSGLALVCGATGAGKTTTLAAFLQTINDNKAKHIITLEDPIEYILKPNKSFISQREYQRDFKSFPKALRAALREDPDIILVGELRDSESLKTAIMASLTGVMVIATLHTRGAIDTLRRIENMLPHGEQDLIRASFAEAMLGIFSQDLILAKDGRRTAVSEVLIGTPAVRNIIRQGKLSQLEASMMSSEALGMRTRDMALKELRAKGVI